MATAEADARPDRPAGKALKTVFVQRRAKTRHDFSHDKTSTVSRRIRRRMALQDIATIDACAAFLSLSDTEANALFRDLLIGATNFCRDAEAFSVLQDRVLPQLIAGRAPGQPLRVWVPGCASGEEACSIAMLLLDHFDAPVGPQVVQVFATDIDDRAIATARTGLSPGSIAADLTPERLSRHVSVEPQGGGYRVRKTLRDTIVFFRARPGARSTGLEAAPHQLPQAADLPGRAPARARHPDVPPRHAGRRHAVPGQIRVDRHRRRPVRGAGPQGQAVPAHSGGRRRASGRHGPAVAAGP